MTRSINVVCDHCHETLLLADSTPKYRLTLVAEELSHKKGVSIKMIHVRPPIPEDKHFCGIDCLRYWCECL